ncbi:uncharacterized protein BDR25DRAFT_349360 [Lindgomyces ingoldianus]|uniref:Uncharacterized protein n=1 Tax=Lindgomyces ingoldianus TaxID=673940 RepID=A0ACB6RCL3_9PLEO|nr:uncharacterized protein BDR25DRAFT_349360 [Lindgomyces ingoldianus]KAF2476247.1 hypothetical protein BDR25DRAFT_349360 [Lindgomyces ingoldianus]
MSCWTLHLDTFPMFGRSHAKSNFFHVHNDHCRPNARSHICTENISLASLPLLTHDVTDATKRSNHCNFASWGPLELPFQPLGVYRWMYLQHSPLSSISTCISSSGTTRSRDSSSQGSFREEMLDLERNVDAFYRVCNAFSGGSLGIVWHFPLFLFDSKKRKIGGYWVGLGREARWTEEYLSSFVMGWRGGTAIQRVHTAIRIKA